MANAFVIFLVAITCFTSMTVVDTLPERYTHNLKVKYFTNVEMHCDHINLNISAVPQDQIVKLQWLFPDGTLRDSDSYLNHEMYQFAGINDTKAPSGQRLIGYTLKAFKIDDDVFGYYTCIVVLRQSPNTGGVTNTGNERVVAIRWGLNVNGADFSDLIETYKENAIIGGIAAGVALLLIGSGWLIWFYCFNKNDERYSADVLKEDATNGSIEMHENAAYSIEKGETRDTKSSAAGKSESDIVQF